MNEFLFETPYWRVELVDDQTYLGRSCIILKRDNVKHLSEVNTDEMEDFLNLVKKAETLIKKTFGATHFNWTCLMNNAYKEENPKPHVHWHLKPRYKNNVEFEGITFEDLEFGHHYKTIVRTPVNSEMLKKIADKIKENL